MNYPGNPSLGTEAQKRILGTFEQTLDLAAEGSRQEALLGCDFILRMDPQFEPARRLSDRLNQGDGRVAIEDLRPGNGAAAPAAMPSMAPMPPAVLPTPPPSELDGLDFDFGLPELTELDEPGADLGTELRALAAERRFRELLERAEAESAALAADPGLLAVVESARERMESEPYVEKFLAKARAARQAGQAEEAARLVQKAASLDPTHPGIAALGGTAPASAGPMGVAEPPRTPPPGLAAPPAAPSAAIPAPLRPPPEASFLDEAGSHDSESARRIAQLLGEGQAAFEGGDHQGAIDSWSRIFLIDIDHQEAARRIDQARKLKAEGERQVEEVFHDGLSSLEAGDADAARAAFERVLALQPGHLAAREQIEILDSGRGAALYPGAGPGLAAAPSAVAPPAPAAAAPVLPAVDVATGELKEEILVPPEPGERPAPRKERREPAAAVREGSARRTFLMIGTAVLALVLVTAWFLYQNKDRLFPNSQEELTAPPPQSPIVRAQALHDSGKTAIAVAQLRRVAPSDPHYREAQALIAKWEALANSGLAVSGPPPEQAARHAALLEEARQAYTGRSFLRAAELFTQAAAIAELTGSDAQAFLDTKRALEPLRVQLQLFNDHEWESALPQLWRLHEADPGNLDISRLIVDAYYNLGVRELQRSDPTKAVQNFNEALAIAPQDPGLRRHLLFAQSYQERPQDLLYRIYVKYLTFR